MGESLSPEEEGAFTLGQGWNSIMNMSTWFFTEVSFSNLSAVIIRRRISLFAICVVHYQWVSIHRIQHSMHWTESSSVFFSPQTFMCSRVTPFLTLCSKVLLPAFFWYRLMSWFQICYRFLKFRKKIAVAGRLKVNFGQFWQFSSYCALLSLLGEQVIW